MCSPDIPGADPRIAEAALKSSETADKALAWYQNIYQKDLRPQAERTAKLNERVVQQQMDLAQQNADISREVYDYQKNTFRPVEQSLATEAMTYDAEGKGEQKAAQARADAEMAFASAQAANERNLGRMGVRPDSGRAIAMDRTTGAMKAAAIASGMTKAREQADAVGWARKADAANLGRGLASQQASAAQIALAGGNSASQVQGSTGAGMRADAQLAGQGFNTAISGYGTAGNLYTGYSGQNQNAAIQAASMKNDQIGTAIGAAGRIAYGKIIGS